jgi:hypothetical protein
MAFETTLDRPNIVISRSFSAYFWRLPLISSANAEEQLAFSGDAPAKVGVLNSPGRKARLGELAKPGRHGDCSPKLEFYVSAMAWKELTTSSGPLAVKNDS